LNTVRDGGERALSLRAVAAGVYAPFYDMMRASARCARWRLCYERARVLLRVIDDMPLRRYARYMPVVKMLRFDIITLFLYLIRAPHFALPTTPQHYAIRAHAAVTT